MNAQLVLGSVAYGMNNAEVPAAITAQKDIATLAPGSHLVLLDGKTVFVTGGSLANVERVQFVVGLANTESVPGMSNILMSVPIKRRNVLSVDHEAYSAGRVQIVTLEFSGIASDAEGDGEIVLSDNSYNRTIKNDKIIVSYYKKKATTVSAMIDAIVAKINNHNQSYPVASSFVTAAKAGTTVTLTMANPNIDFSISMAGLFQNVVKTVTQTAIVSITQAVDILKSEKEFSGNMGNGNYESLGDAYWSFPQQTNLATQYDIFNIKFQGEHDLPQNRVRSAVMWLKIAVPTARAAAFKTLLDTLFGQAYDKAAGDVVPASDKGAEVDGNPAT